MNNKDKYNDKKMDDDNYSLKDRIGCILFLIWFIGSILIMVSSKKYFMISLIQFFLVFVVGALKNSKVKMLSLLFKIGKMVCGVIVFFYFFYFLKIIFNWDWDILFRVFVVAVVIIFISYFLLIKILRISRLKKKCIVSIEANIVRYECDKMHKVRKKLYSPVYRFNYNNMYYEVCWHFFSNTIKFKPINSVVNIKINPNNPYEIFVLKDKALIEYVLLICIASGLCIISFVYVIIAILFNM